MCQNALKPIQVHEHFIKYSQLSKMSEKDRQCTNEAVEKIIGNITSEMQNVDGQYVPLGFTPPPAEPLNWTPPQNPYINHYNMHNSELGYGSPLEPFSQPQFGYIQQPHHLFNSNIYNKNLKLNYDLYANESSDVFDSDYRLLAPQTHHRQNFIADPSPPSNTHTQLIENLVGNWMPTTSGTYSPFGNDPFKPSVGVFENTTEMTSNIIGEPFDQPHDDKQFQFNRNTKKPRMVAEVKPMRPSYSDVLTKPVPQTKITKVDPKETKQKKESNKKNNKMDKDKKNNSNSLNRNSTNNDLKDLSNDKTQFIKIVTDKMGKTGKVTQLNRKWASLDNIAEPLNQSNKSDEVRKRKTDDVVNKIQKPVKKVNKSSDTNDDSISNKSENLNVNKNGVKKSNKFNGRQKNFETFERPPGKRNQRTRKRENHVPFGVVGIKMKQYLKGWWKYLTVFIFWLFNLISDVFSLSLQISRDLACNFWSWLCIHWEIFLETSIAVMKRIRLLTWIWEKFKGKEKPSNTNKDNNRFIHTGLQNNINMPTTGDEAMKRLLACKGKDPYSILGVTPTCTDEDIKRYYKRQAFLVHPDKNQQPGAEEAFKILVHAFDMIGEPERRASYDKGVVESVQVEQAWSELTELLAQLQQKVEAAANTIRCSACSLRHKRIKVDRPCYAARNCSSCKIHHAAREGDIWAEARCFGFLWHYYACMEGGVYDITDWAGCQKDSLKHLRPDSHQVQYRIALGKQNSQARRHSGSPRTERPPDLENLLNTLYGQADTSGSTRRRTKKAK